MGFDFLAAVGRRFASLASLHSRIEFAQMLTSDLANLSIGRFPHAGRWQTKSGSAWRQLDLRRVEGHDPSILYLRSRKATQGFLCEELAPNGKSPRAPSKANGLPYPSEGVPIPRAGECSPGNRAGKHRDSGANPKGVPYLSVGSWVKAVRYEGTEPTLGFGVNEAWRRTTPRVLRTLGYVAQAHWAWQK